MVFVSTYMSRAHKHIDPDDLLSTATVTSYEPTLHSKLSDFKKKIKILRFIPKEARTLAAYKLSLLIANAVTKNDISSWTSLLIFPPCRSLGDRPGSTSDSNGCSTQTVVVTRVRPIAVANIYRRLASQIACASVSDIIGSCLRPSQLGFATKHGCETTVEQNLYKGLCEPESGAWLNVLPFISLDTLLNNNLFKIAIALHLGLNLNPIYTCACGVIVLPNGHHGLSCKKVYAKISRHQRINEVMRPTLNTAGYPSILEPPELSRTDNKRLDGMTHFSWSEGKPLVWNFTCINTLAPCCTQQLISKPGLIAELAANKKRAKYVDIEEQGYLFVPIAVETIGPWSLNAIKLIKDIGHKIRILTDDKRSSSYLIQRISLEIQRRNASCVLNTFPPSEKLN
ncbi:hypothetical protein ILUMI_20238 [Ignelater luminosus]|uniref:Uncharacterized protein n=1 Tax=Ignelater luminosus TaxID=2038154 RepID=A0A8K0G4S9_IGNLU|nr:hypothetical protein ILUMI_20238 [Ignelater luminosus]